MPIGRPPIDDPSLLAGRDQELAYIDAFVTATGRGLRGLLIQGEAGIGKTALWRVALDRLRGRSSQLLIARAAEDELRGSMIGLHDLFDGVAADVVGEAGELLEPDTDPFERGRAALRALRAVTTRGATVLAIDDVQWLDPVTARTLRYALRRMEEDSLTVLATQRTDGDSAVDVELLPGDRTELLTLEALPVTAIRQVVAPIRSRLSRPLLEWIYVGSGGNPMHARELARTADPVGDRLSAAAAPSLRSTVADRLAEAPPTIRHLVQTSAALGAASPDLLQRASGRPEDAATLSDALDRELLTLDESMLVRCAHPLLGSVALSELEPGERRTLHGQLAGLVVDPDDRARHLALAATERDASVSAELEEAAQRAGRRGASALAAELSAHSVRLTPSSDGPAFTRRAVNEILHRAAAGELARAIATVDTIVASLPPSRARAGAIALRVGLDYRGTEGLLDQALAEAADDELLRGRILDVRGYILTYPRGEIELAQQVEEEALRIARQHGDAELEVLSSGALATASLLAGTPRPELLDRAIELDEQMHTPRLGRWPDIERARHVLWAGHVDTARTMFRRRFDLTSRAGLEVQRPFRLFDLAFVELSAGELELAALLTAEGLEAALDAGNTPAATWLRYPHGLAHAHLGNLVGARAAATDLKAWGREHDEPPRLLMGHHVAGMAALIDGDPVTALDELVAAVDVSSRTGHRHPGSLSALPDAVEAAAAAGEEHEVRTLAAELTAQAEPLAEPWSTAAAQRAAGLAVMVASSGDEAPTALADAAGRFAALGCRLDAARALWWHGESLRRLGQRAAAARSFAAAGEQFTAMAATPWADQARASLARVDTGAPTETLSTTESRIAELAAAGHRNREIAATVHVSVATVEANLTRIYRKLGVRSRTELGRHRDQFRSAGS